ncbi:MAG: Glycosyltransferase [Bacteroidetes bacterium]|jgi:cellulose synthase/poly-beta-1,6-N-acetylglucosamine synthase-like glycosyltransferase|nr:Glycosyltransferase [Bacteroidota bacterium]
MIIASMFFRQEILHSPFFTDLVLYLYFFSLLILFTFGAHGFVMVYHYLKTRGKDSVLPALEHAPVVTVQLPVYNEYYVVDRLIEAVCSIEYPKDKLEIQVLDDSTDETVDVVAKTVKHFQGLGYDIKHVHRTNRQGYKAGALKHGLETARGEFIAIFDADFVPNTTFLLNTVPYFEDEELALVQTRWEHLNSDYSLLTRTQAMALDAHFVMEQGVRNKVGFFINFNGTGGIWRKSAIIDAGNWQSDTLTEDLDLSYRAQLRGWKFKYLNDVTSPAELPAEVNALKSQQFRWTKGAIETARKILPEVWRSNIPLRVKIHSTFHLTNNLAFPFILLAGILNVPLIFIKQQGGHDLYFAMMSVFVLAFIGSFMFYMFSQKAVYPDWRRRLLLFPLFMAGSMGFAVNNSRAVFEGLIKKRSEFVRTPKYKIEGKTDSWMLKKYVPMKLNWVVFVEIALAVYCFFGVISSLYYLEIAAVPFQLLYCMGFSFVSALSIKHALEARKLRQQQPSV